MLRRENDRAQVFKIAKQITTTNRDIAGDKCVKNDGRGGGGDLATSDHGKHLSWKEDCQRLLNDKLEWNKDTVSVNNPIIGSHPQTDTESVRKALNKMKKGKLSRLSGVVSEMLLASGDVGIVQMTNLFNKIIAKNEVPGVDV